MESSVSHLRALGRSIGWSRGSKLGAPSAFLTRLRAPLGGLGGVLMGVGHCLGRYLGSPGVIVPGKGVGPGFSLSGPLWGSGGWRGSPRGSADFFGVTVVISKPSP